MFSKEFILVLNFITLLKFSHEFHYSEPNLENPLIPLKWRQRCGYRLHPMGIPKISRCLLRTLVSEEEYYNRSIRSVRTDPSNRVLKGRNVYPRESPWTVQIATLNKNIGWHYHCTGVLITMRHILTAAHCIKPGVPLVIYGGSDWAGPQLWQTDQFYYRKHQNVNETDPQELDIAVIILDNRIDNDYHGWDLMNFNTICLPLEENWTEDKFMTNTAQNATFYGWGYTQHRLPRVLQRADIQVRYRRVDGENWNQFFVTYKNRNTTRACRGDSGSGLIQYLDNREERAVIIGIYSSNSPTINCDPDYEEWSAFVRVVSHLQFINEVLRDTSHEDDFD